MKILSLFDGISCGMVALERAGIEISEYVAYEIDPYAIKVSQHNYPTIKQRGDVTKADFTEYAGFDRIIAGSPCQDLSSYKKNRPEGRKELAGDKSKLFFEFVRAMEEVKPKYFLFENVASMSQESQDVITEILGVKPIFINSSIITACERPRLYWTNIPVTSPLDSKEVYLKDIIVPADEVPAKYWYTNREYAYNGDDKKVQCTLLGSGLQRNMREVYNLNAKCNTLLCDGGGGNRQKKVYQDGRCRKLMPIEYERLQTLPDNYTSCISDSRRYTAVGNGWTVDVIAYILSFLKN